MLEEERRLRIRVLPDQIQNSGIIRIGFPRESRYAGWSVFIDLKQAEVDRTELNSFILNGTRDTCVVIFQIVLVMIVMISTALVPLGPIAKCIFFIGALMAVMNASAGIAQLLGGDVGVGTAFQQMQSLMMLSQGAQLAGQAITAAGAGAMYLGGRAVGGTSLLSGAGAVADAAGTLSGGSRSMNISNSINAARSKAEQFP